MVNKYGLHMAMMRCSAQGPALVILQEQPVVSR